MVQEGWPAALKDGRLVHESPEGIVLHEEGKKPRLWIEGGRWPRWSRNGNALFFIRGKEIGWKDYRSGKETMILRMTQPSVLAVYDHGREVWVGEGQQVKALNPETGELRLVIEDDTFRELDVGPDGKRMVATVRGKRGGNIIRYFDLQRGETRDIGKGCSASLSPDGTLATNNVSGHQELYLTQVKDGRLFKSLKTPEGHRTDNQYWSTHPDWVVALSEKKGQILAQRVTDGKVWILTEKVNADRPDLWVP
ncbi:hypothetical protein P0Y35_18135 [Kiritimatiellaeota bacterium B1221]|nr:hypothetical protein [Kiritimatiellaeota bacterium B1221]